MDPRVKPEGIRLVLGDRSTPRTPLCGWLRFRARLTRRALAQRAVDQRADAGVRAARIEQRPAVVAQAHADDLADEDRVRRRAHALGDDTFEARQRVFQD